MYDWMNEKMMGDCCNDGIWSAIFKIESIDG